MPGVELAAPEIEELQQQLATVEAEEVKLKQEYEKKAFQAANLDAYRQQMVEMEESFGALVSQLFGATCVPLDARPTAAAAARRFYGQDPVVGDAERLPLRAGSFDVVISTETIESTPISAKGVFSPGLPSCGGR